MPNLLAFGGTAFVMTMLPGLDTALVLRTAAMDSRRHGAMTALGIGLGCLCWGTAVALGLVAVLQASAFGFEALRWAGAGYLGWLGIGMLVSPRRTPIVSDRPAEAAASGGEALRRGFATNILNPKAGMFYLTLLPHFVPAGSPIAYSFLLASLHVALAVTWFTLLAVGVGTIAPALRRPVVARRMDVVTGCVFVGLALRLVTAAHS